MHRSPPFEIPSNPIPGPLTWRGEKRIHKQWTTAHHFLKRYHVRSSVCPESGPQVETSKVLCAEPTSEGPWGIVPCLTEDHKPCWDCSIILTKLQGSVLKGYCRGYSCACKKHADVQPQTHFAYKAVQRRRGKGLGRPLLQMLSFSAKCSSNDYDTVNSYDNIFLIFNHCLWFLYQEGQQTPHQLLSRFSGMLSV